MSESNIPILTLATFDDQKHKTQRHESILLTNEYKKNDDCETALIGHINTQMQIFIQHVLVIRDRTLLFGEQIKLKYFTSIVTFKRIVL